LRPPDFYTENAIELRLGTTATALDVAGDVERPAPPSRHGDEADRGKQIGHWCFPHLTSSNVAFRAWATFALAQCSRR
jgi:hypothetical protein